MAKIYEYGGSNTKTATGKKWEGNVIAVPKGWKTGVEYEITLQNGNKLKALAVDTTGGESFAMPRGGELAKQVSGQKIGQIGLPTTAAPVLTAKNLDKALEEFSPKLEISGFAGLDVTAQSSGRVNLTPAGQASAKYELSKKDYFRAGVSLRPYRHENGNYDLARPFITTANYTHNFSEKASIQLGVPDLLLGNIAYNTIGKNPCGCSGNAPPGKVASMAGLHLGSGLVETNGLGGAATYQTDNNQLTLGAVSVLQSDIFKRGEVVGYAAAHHDFEKTRVTGNVAISNKQQSYNLGAQHWLNHEKQIRVNTGVDRGEKNRERIDLMGVYYANERNTYTIGAGYRHEGGKHKKEVSAGWAHAMDKDGKWLLNARAATDFGKDHSLSIGVSESFKRGLEDMYIKQYDIIILAISSMCYIFEIPYKKERCYG